MIRNWEAHLLQLRSTLSGALGSSFGRVDSIDLRSYR
jgi:hypothetical protein